MREKHITVLGNASPASRSVPTRCRVNRYFAAIILALFAALSLPFPSFSAKSFKTWNVDAASKHVETRTRKPYTVMVYMNGSDLESEGGSATDDLVEMLDAGLDPSSAHLVVLTGGASRWMNDVVPENECVLWEITDGWFNEITGIGPANMGNPGTLSSFIKFSAQNFPADKYGLIMWDHGGGAIDGYGYDEKYVDGNLTLMDMKDAFRQAGLHEKPLEFLGFDSCLMATVEMSAVASDYAKYLIASEDLEPGGGWNYNFLTALNGNPGIDGKELGINIVDGFMDFYGEDTDEILNLSVIDLSKARTVSDSLGELMRPCSESLIRDKTASFKTLAGKRVRTKTFGEGSPRDNECDMVDIGDMAAKLEDLYPEQAEKVLSALDDCVVYNRHNSRTDLRGLSAYYIYGGKDMGEEALTTYVSLPVSPAYTQYLKNFYSALTGQRQTRGRSRSSAQAQSPEPETVRTQDVLWQPVKYKEGLYRMAGLKDLIRKEWPHFCGKPVCLFPVSQTGQNRHYAIPAQINGRDCDIIVVFNDRYPGGMVEGTRNFTGTIIQKGYSPIIQGDKIVLYSLMYDERLRDGNIWEKLPEFVFQDSELKLTWKNLSDGYVKGKRLTDIYGEVKYEVSK